MHHSQPTFAGSVAVPTETGRPSRLLAIGSSGFIGGHLARIAADGGLSVVGTAREPAEGLLRCDLRDPDSVSACVRAAEPELVVNLAGAPSVAASWADPLATYETNAIGSLNLCLALVEHAPAAHLLCLSSAQVYGEPADAGRPFAEDSPLGPMTPYGNSKLAMEAIAARFAASDGLRVAVARLFNQVGPGQSPSQATAEFAREIAAAEAAGRGSVELRLATPGTARDFTDVRDSAGALLEISRRGLTGVYNLCSGRATPIDTVIEELRGMTELEVEVSAADGASRAGPSSSFGDPTRLREAIGWEPRTPLRRSLADLLDSWRARAGDAKNPARQ
jgi:GDP-4-dehydro-6-deoxy-D-mannose reductase